MTRVVILLVLTASGGTAQAGDLHVNAFASFSPQAEFGTITGDTYGPESGGTTYQVGLGGSVSRRFGNHFDLAVGPRYDYGGATGPWAIGDDTLHIIALPIAAALVFPIGAFELEPAFAVGPGLGYSPGYRGASWMYDITAELAVTFAQRRRPGLFLQLGAKLDWLEVIGGGAVDGPIVNTQLPFLRVGATWR